MEFELGQSQSKKEFEVSEEGTITINGAMKGTYEKFYRSFKRKSFRTSKKSPEKFLSIFESFIKECGFNLNGQMPVIGDTILICGLKDTLSNIGPIFSDDNINQQHTIPSPESFKWIINSNLDFDCHPQSAAVECSISIGGTGGIKKERADELLRLALLVNYPQAIKLTSEGKRYLINVVDYAQIKTNLALIVQTISTTNEIVMRVSESVKRLILDMKKGKHETKEFLDNLI